MSLRHAPLRPSGPASSLAPDCVQALAVAKGSSCPGDWLDGIKELVNRSGTLVYVNIGANKGYNVAEFMQRFPIASAKVLPTNDEWHKQIMLINPNAVFSCGMCSDCKKTAPARPPMDIEAMRVIAVDMLHSNVQLLARLFEAFNVPGKAIHAAGSNSAGTVYAPSGVDAAQNDTFYSAGQAGIEQIRAMPKAGPVRFSRYVRFNYTQEVRAVTVDELLRDEGLHAVTLLSVDTEGHDSLVLEGAERSLSERRIELLEFEYSGIGFWDPKHEASRRLKPSLERLQRMRYECFWAGHNGKLAPASGAFWCDTFESHQWSNLVCAHAPRIVRAMYAHARSAGTAGVVSRDDRFGRENDV